MPYESANAKCPWYAYDKKYEVVCAGWQDKIRIHREFDSEAEKKEYMARYCENVKGCQDCEVHQMAVESQKN